MKKKQQSPKKNQDKRERAKTQSPNPIPKSIEPQRRTERHTQGKRGRKTKKSSKGGGGLPQRTV